MTCHQTDDWKNIKQNSFNHDKTAFPLTGQHKDVQCKKCHTSLIFNETKKDCNSCHADVHQQTVGNDCERCHTTTTWVVQNVNQMHAQTKFPLRGSHAQLDCFECHKSTSKLRFDPMSSECFDCHAKDYFATKNPNHTEAKFPTDCTVCHNERSWLNSTFDHNTTSFPLKNAHFGVDCTKCHDKGYTNTSSECYSCHKTDYDATKEPNHVLNKFSTECTSCHNDVAWKPSTFDHNVNTTFPIKGGHVGVDCVQCHTNGYVNTSSTCVSCHQKDYNATTNPNHVTAKFSTECTTCHNETAWKPSTFNHNVNTTFPIKGGHVGVDCIQCHTNGYVNTPSTCVSCHQKDYNATTNPNHTTAKFSTECTTCHNETAWKPSTFNHNVNTSFPLKGGHVGVDCIQCHTNGYVNTPSTCVSCHQKDYNATTNPNHVTAKFSTECTTCHNETAWKPSTFNHNVNTSFPIIGGHIGVECAQCHTNGYVNTSSACVSCHQKDYNATTNPNHTIAKFSTQCTTCHTQTAWIPTTFNHNTNTSFPLKGGHIGVDCIKCHTNGYNNTSTDCYSCHAADYNKTTSPAHATAHFSTECKTCHNETAWKPSTFNHDAQYFPIYSGKHQGEWNTCTDCHKNASNFKAFTCTDCHEHNKTDMDKEHKGKSGYVYNSVNCYACHPKGRS
jgi:nitrate/TMAO reductase-like tetraheme cytochrome c subunit